jgi:hypothetical protein
MQLQVLMNRVTLLDQEERRTRQRALATKKQAAEIFFGKVLNEDKIRQRMHQQAEKARQQEQLRIKIYHMREMARRETLQRELDKQRRVQNNVVVRTLVKEANMSRKELESELSLAEAREKKEAIAREERKVRDSVERFKKMRESMSRAMRDERIQKEQEQSSKTDELLRIYQDRESDIIERLKHTASTEAQAR